MQYLDLQGRTQAKKQGLSRLTTVVHPPGQQRPHHSCPPPQQRPHHCRPSPYGLLILQVVPPLDQVGHHHSAAHVCRGDQLHRRLFPILSGGRLCALIAGPASRCSRSVLGGRLRPLCDTLWGPPMLLVLGPDVGGSALQYNQQGC